LPMASCVCHDIICGGAARRKERVRKLDVDRVAGESLKKLKEVRAAPSTCC
jgi:hypothetical protein